MTNKNQQYIGLTSPDYEIGSFIKNKHQRILDFLFFAVYDVVCQTFEHHYAAHLQKKQKEQNKQAKNAQIVVYFQMISERLHNRILRQDIDLDRLLSKLQLAWQRRGISEFHRYYFLKYTHSAYLDNIAALFKTQAKLIVEGQHIYYSINRLILDREACLRKLKDQLAQLQPKDIHHYVHVTKERTCRKIKKQEAKEYKIKGYKIKKILDKPSQELGETPFDEVAGSLRILEVLTVSIVEKIATWKQYLCSLTHDVKKHRQRIEFYFEQQNYLLKILQDLNFMKGTFLSNFYEFAPHNDPFLLRCQMTNSCQPDSQLLKSAFLPASSLMPSILEVVNILYQEYLLNIKSRKIYNLKKLSLVCPMQRNSHLQPPRGNSLDQNWKISGPKLNIMSLKTFRTHNVIDKEEPNSIKKPYSLIKDPLNEEVILEDRKHYLKVKEEPQWKGRQSCKQSISQQVKRMFRQKQLNSNKVKSKIEIKLAKPQTVSYQQSEIQMNPISLPIQDIEDHVETLYDTIDPSYHSLQLECQRLLKKLKQLDSYYIIQAISRKSVVGTIIAHKETERNSMKVLYVWFCNIQILEPLMLRFVQFIEKYQQCFKVYFQFRINQSLGSDLETDIGYLQQQLTSKCLVISKDTNEGTHKRFVFKLQAHGFHKTLHQPQNLQVDLSLILAAKPLRLTQQRLLQPTCYYYVLMHILSEHLSADQIYTLKDEYKSKQGLHQILEIMIGAPSQSVSFNEEVNISELHKQLLKKGQKIFELEDLITVNSIKHFRLKLSLSLKYQLRLCNYQTKRNYLVYKVNGSLLYWEDDFSNCYYDLQTKEDKQTSIALFEIDKLKQKIDNNNLMPYLARLFRVKKQLKRKIIGEVNNLWIPMSTTFGTQDIYMPTYRLDDLNPINMELYIGGGAQWQAYMPLQNGFKIKETKKDLFIKPPFGIAVLHNKSYMVFLTIFC